MDMEKIMAYVEKIAENLEGLVCAIGCESMPSDGAFFGCFSRLLTWGK